MLYNKILYNNYKCGYKQNVMKIEINAVLNIIQSFNTMNEAEINHHLIVIESNNLPMKYQMTSTFGFTDDNNRMQIE